MKNQRNEQTRKKQKNKGERKPEREMASRGVSIAPGKPAVAAAASEEEIEYEEVEELDEEEVEEIEEIEEIEEDVGPPVLLAEPWKCDLLDREFVGSVLATESYVIVGTMSGKVIVLDSRGEFPVNSGQALRGHEGMVDDIAVDAAEEFVASVSRQGTVLVQPIIRRDGSAGHFEQKGSMPLTSVALHPNFASESEKPLVWGGSEGIVTLCTRGGFFGNTKKTSLDTGCGPVAAISWRGNFIVWVGRYICVYNYSSKSVVGNIALPKAMDSPQSFRCSLFWENDRNFVVGWSNVVRAVAIDHERVGPYALKLTNSYDTSLAANETPHRVLSIVGHDEDHFLVMLTRESESSGSNQRMWYVTAPLVVKSDRFGTWKDTPEQYVVCDRKQRPNHFFMVQSPDKSDIFIVTPDGYLRARRATIADQINHFSNRREWDKAYKLAMRNVATLDAALVEKCGIGMLNGLFLNGQYEECAKQLSTVLRHTDGAQWGNWIDRFEQTYHTHLLVDRLPRGPDLKPQLRPHYEIVLARELDRDIRAFRHAMVTLDGNFAIPPVLRKLRDRVSESKSTGETKDLECLCLAKLYELQKDFPNAMRYYLEVRDKKYNEPYNFIRKHELWGETIQNLPALIMHNADETLNILVEKRNVHVASRDKQGSANRHFYADADMDSNISHADQHQAVFDPIKVVQQLQDLVLGESRNKYMWSYLSKLRVRNREAFEGVVKKFPVHVLDLQAEIDPQGLLAFMKEYECFVVAGAIQWSGKAKARGFVEEHAFIEAKLGHREQALSFMFSELRSVSKAVTFIKEHFYSVPERKDMFQRIISEALAMDRALDSAALRNTSSSSASSSSPLNGGSNKYFEYEPRHRFESWQSIADRFSVQPNDLLDLNSIQNINDPLPAASGTTGKVVVRIPSRMIESLLSVLSQPSEEDESQWLDPIFLLEQLPESRKIAGLCDSLRRITNLSRAHYDMNETLFFISQKDVFDTMGVVRNVRRSAIKFIEPLSFCDSCQKPFEPQGDDAVRFRACEHSFHHTCLVSGVVSDVALEHQENLLPTAFLDDPWKYASNNVSRAGVFPACLLCDAPIVSKV